MNDVTLAPGWLGAGKALAFALHMIPTQVALGAALVAALAALTRGDFSGRLARRTAAIVPGAVALAIALGVPSLMFNQVAYAADMERATAARGWMWFGIIPLLLLTYAAAHELSIRFSEGGPGRIGGAAGVAAAIGLLAASRFFTNLTAGMGGTGPDGWRWALWLGLTLMTTAVWLFVDAGRATGEPPAWRGRAAALARNLHLAGLIVFAFAGIRHAAGMPGGGPRTASGYDPVVQYVFVLGLLLPLAAQVTMRLTLLHPLSDFAPWRGPASGPLVAAALQIAGLLVNAGAREWARLGTASAVPVHAPGGLLLAVGGLATLGAAFTVWTIYRVVHPSPIPSDA